MKSNNFCACDQCLRTAELNAVTLREAAAKAIATANEVLGKCIREMNLKELVRFTAHMNREASEAYLNRDNLRQLTAYGAMCAAGPLIAARFKELHQEILGARVAMRGEN